MKDSAKSQKKISITTKVTIVILLIISINTIAITTFGFIIHRNEVIRNYSNRSMAIAKTAAMSIDTGEFWNALDTNEKNEHYMLLHERFNQIKDEENLLYFYGGAFDPEAGMIMYLEGHDSRFGLNGHVPLSIFPQAAFDAFEHGTAHVSDVYRLNIDGSWGISAYAPIMCDNNEAIGLIGVLISLSDPISRSSDFAMRMLPFSLLSFFVLMWIPLYYVRRLEAKKEKAYEQAAAAIKAKSEFLSNMSHEIRTPINAITGMASIGKSSEDIKQMAYCFERVEDASGLLLGTINNILDMSKIDSGKFDLSASEFSFEKMLHSVINTVNQQIHEKRLKLKVSIDRTIPEIVIGDEQRLAHIVFNLMSNAIKFSPEEGSIHIGTYFLGEKDGICTIKATVTDSGIGISPEQQPNLFSPFWQLESSMSRQFDGSGLGLTISKNIVEMMGGKIWVESEFEKGATFAFTIKVKKGVAKKRNFLERGITWSNVRVLVVDDDPDTRDFFMKITGTLGVKCDTASSGEEALGLVEQGKAYDICFVDWLLPEIDGFELARILKTKAENPENIAVIVFSAAALDTANDNDKGAYIDKYLSKPLFPFTIIDTINDCLGMADDGHIRKMKHETLPQFAGRRILLVEDVEINREIVLTLLKPTLIEIICVDNGKDAVSTFSEAPEKYDLILMDLQMPQMDGYEATRNIRALDFPKAKAIPILAMTAHSFDEDVVKCLNVGMNGHIGKPLDYDELLEQLFIYLSDM